MICGKGFTVLTWLQKRLGEARVMLGFSYGEIFLLIGATAALVGPKDLPRIARTVGRLTGRAIGYVQVARGHFDKVMQQSQARQVHKELQDVMAQVEVIRHEMRSISLMNPGPMTRGLVDNITQTSAVNVENDLRPPGNCSSLPNAAAKINHFDCTTAKNCNSPILASSDVLSQATTYAKLAESKILNSGSTDNEVLKELTHESGIIVLPVSAESAGLLPNQKDDIKGSDIVLQAMLEERVAHDAKEFVGTLKSK